MVCIDFKTTFLGTFDTKDEAQAAIKNEFKLLRLVRFCQTGKFEEDEPDEHEFL